MLLKIGVDLLDQHILFGKERRSICASQYLLLILIVFISARINQPETLRALYGLTDTRNSFHGSGTGFTRKF
jgi:hypothetical protein